MTRFDDCLEVQFTVTHFLPLRAEYGISEAGGGCSRCSLDISVRPHKIFHNSFAIKTASTMRQPKVCSLLWRVVALVLSTVAVVKAQSFDYEVDSSAESTISLTDDKTLISNIGTL
jgi:hypothetical protein